MNADKLNELNSLNNQITEAQNGIVMADAICAPLSMPERYLTEDEIEKVDDIMKNARKKVKKIISFRLKELQQQFKNA